MNTSTVGEIDELVLRLARSGLQGPELVLVAARALCCPTTVVRSHVLDRYPGLLRPARTGPDFLKWERRETRPQRDRFQRRDGDVYSLPWHWRQGGHTF